MKKRRWSENTCVVNVNQMTRERLMGSDCVPVSILYKSCENQWLHQTLASELAASPTQLLSSNQSGLGGTLSIKIHLNKHTFETKRFCGASATPKTPLCSTVKFHNTQHMVTRGEKAMQTSGNILVMKRRQMNNTFTITALGKGERRETVLPRRSLYCA